MFVANDVSLNARLNVAGDVSFNRRLFVASDVSLNARLNVAGDVSLNSRLFLASDLSVAGLSTFTGLITASSGVKITNTTSYFGFDTGISNSTAASSPVIKNGIVIGTGSGNTNALYDLAINSNYGIGFVNTYGNNCSIYFDVRNGQINSTTFNATSDYRIKENVISLDHNFIVDKLNPVHYYNKSANRNDIGFLAHEVQEHFPYLVKGEKDGPDVQSINYNGFIGLLVKEVKLLKNELKLLKDENKRTYQIYGILFAILFSFMLSFVHT